MVLGWDTIRVSYIWTGRVDYSQSLDAREMRAMCLKKEQLWPQRREGLKQEVIPLPGHPSASSDLLPVLIIAQEGRELTLLGA